MTKTKYDPDRSLILIEGLPHFITNCLQNLASCHSALSEKLSKNYEMYLTNTQVSVKISTILLNRSRDFSRARNDAQPCTWCNRKKCIYFNW
jgi:hypothetical protein